MCAHSTASHAQTSRFCCLATSLFFPRPLIRSCRALIRGGASQHRNALQRRSGERVGVSVTHYSHSTARSTEPVHHNTHKYICRTCLVHLLRSLFSQLTSPRIHHNGLHKYFDTECHATTTPVGGNLTRSERQNSELQTDRNVLNNLTATQIDFDSARQLSAEATHENIVVRKEAQESSAQTRISEKVARGELHTLERNVCSALLDQNQQFQAENIKGEQEMPPINLYKNLQ